MTTNSKQPNEIYLELKQYVQKNLHDLAQIAFERDEKFQQGEIDQEEDGDEIILLSHVIKGRSENLDNPFRVAVVGHFSRGKSTLINALIGRQLLKSDVIPNTAVSTFLHHGTPERFRVSYRSDSGFDDVEIITKNIAEDIAEYTSDSSVGVDENEAIERYEQVMQGKKKSLSLFVNQVDIWCDSEFLQETNIDLIDTPGVNAVIKDHQKVTMALLPTVDSLVFIFQADPGLSDRERAFIENVYNMVPSLFLVLTKVDQVSPEEAEMWINLAKKALANKDIEVDSIYPISARNALREGDKGFDAFTDTLRNYLYTRTGAARLKNVLSQAKSWTMTIKDKVENDIEALESEKDALEKELGSIRNQISTIEKNRDELLERIDVKIDEIIGDAEDKIKTLHQTIRYDVEVEIDSLTYKHLKHADEFIQPVIKRSVVAWLRSNQTVLESKLTLLNETVRSGIENILGDVISSKSRNIILENFELEVNTPLTVSGAIDETISGRIINMLSTFGVSDAVQDALRELTDTVVEFAKDVGRAIGGFFSRLLGRKPKPVSRKPSDNDRNNQARKAVKGYLSKTNTDGMNGYQVIVDGNKNTIGIRGAIVSNFNMWREQLKSEVQNVVNRHVNGRITQLEAQIARQIGDFDEDTRKGMKIEFDRQEAALKNILNNIDSLNARLQDME